MKNTAIHIYLSTFENESRILKQTKSLIEYQILERVIVLARGRANLPEFEEFDKNRFVYRVRSGFLKDKIPPRGLGRVTQVIKIFDVLFRFLLIIKKEKPRFINLHQVLLLPLIPFIKLVSSKTVLIYDAHELETETNGLDGFRKKLMKFFERLSIKKFKHIFVVSPSIEEWYRTKYKINNVTTVMNCPYYQKVNKYDFFREEFRIPKESKIFLYQGALFYGRGIEVILNAFAKIDNKSLCVVLMGYGEMEETIKEYSIRHSNIFFKKAVAPNIVLQYTASADFGISLIENVCLSYYYCLPNKLFEYLMAGIPCIVSDMLEMSNYINSHNAGIICKSLDTQGLTESIKEIHNKDFSSFMINIEAIKRQYSWEEQEGVMIDIYNRILRS